MKVSKINKDQFLKIAKATLYVSLSAALDFLISQTAGTEFGVLTPIINIGLVSLKQLFTESK